MVGYAGSPMCTVHADVTLTLYKVKVTQQWPPAPFWGPHRFCVTCLA